MEQDFMTASSGKIHPDEKDKDICRIYYQYSFLYRIS